VIHRRVPATVGGLTLALLCAACGDSADPMRPSESVRRGPFGRALRRFLDSARGAEAEIALLRVNLERGADR